MQLKDYFKENSNYTMEQIRKDNSHLSFKQINEQLNNLIKDKYISYNNGIYSITSSNEKEDKLVVCEIKNNKIYIKDSDTILTTNDDISKLVDGDIIIVKVNNNQCYIIEKIGHKNDPNIDLKIIAISKSIRIEFNKSSLKQLNTIPTQVSSKDIENRLDLRDKMIFTIDGADTKDMDDAISVSKNDQGNYILGVHIADVAHYVKIDTPLYNEAFERGNSVYLIDKVIPMLPHQLSNGICSLNPNEDRLTISCIMEINKNGDIINSTICESVINSKKKMTYEDVDKILMENEIVKGYEPFIENLKLCNELSFILSQNYNSGGYLHFKDNEIKVIVDNNGNPVTFEPIVIKAGRKIIENFMLAANKTVASTYAYMPFCFRIHEEPDMDNLQDVLQTLNVIGYDVPYQNIDRYKLNKIFKELYDQGNYSIISPQLLKTMKKAIYSSNNLGHFGLGFNNYTHFTSPIRRFSDLETHYLIKMYNNPNITDKQLINIETELPAICEHINKMEKLADEAEEEATKLKMVQYMKQHIGDYYNGKIVGIGPKYISVKLENGIIGNVQLHNIKDGKYYFDNEKHYIISMDGKSIYKLADYVRINVIKASLKKYSIDFKIIENLNHVKVKTLTI